METKERKKRIAIIKFSQKQYVEANKMGNNFLPIEKDLKNIAGKLQALSRKNHASENSFKAIPNIATLTIGFQEKLKQNKFPPYDFQKEIELLNEYLIKFLEKNINSLYDGKCKYGESILNGYLDVFIRASVLKTDKQIAAYPTFLINPRTGQNLEIDILFEDFKLGFELQGHESHYSDSSVMNKDAFKLQQSFANKTILIPVNNIQLNSVSLQELIVNTIKDYLGLNDVFKLKTSKVKLNFSPSKKQLSDFSKVVQRLFLSKKLFRNALAYLDSKASTYIQNEVRKRPMGVSNTIVAPTFIAPSNNFCIETVYNNLKYVTEIRKA